MKAEDWILVGSMLLWGLFGFWAGDAYRRHDWVGFSLPFFLWVVFPVGVVGKQLVTQTLWRREWERRYGKKWSESGAAKLERQASGSRWSEASDDE